MDYGFRIIKRWGMIDILCHEEDQWEPFESRGKPIDFGVMQQNQNSKWTNQIVLFVDQSIFCIVLFTGLLELFGTDWKAQALLLLLLLLLLVLNEMG